VLGLPPDWLDEEEDDEGDEEGDEGDDGDDDGIDGDGIKGGCGVDVLIVVSQPATTSPRQTGSSRTQRFRSFILDS
jgi:hypothetical protein